MVRPRLFTSPKKAACTRTLRMYPLFGLKLTAAFKSERNDEMIFYDGTCYFAVHLTWSESGAANPRYFEIKADELERFLRKDL